MMGMDTLINPLAIIRLCIRPVYLFCFLLSPGLGPVCGPPGIPCSFLFSNFIRFLWSEGLMSLTLERPPRSPPLSLPTKFIRWCRTAPRDVWSGAQGECLSLSPLTGRHQEGCRRTWRVLQTSTHWSPHKLSPRETNFTCNSWGGRGHGHFLFFTIAFLCLSLDHLENWVFTQLKWLVIKGLKKCQWKWNLCWMRPWSSHYNGCTTGGEEADECVWLWWTAECSRAICKVQC